MSVERATNILLLAAITGVAIAMAFSMLRAILGPRASDRLISVNLIGTKTIILICLLAVYLREQYVVDVALIYALISFLAVIVLVNAYRTAHDIRNAKKEEREQEMELNKEER